MFLMRFRDFLNMTDFTAASGLMQPRARCLSVIFLMDNIVD